MPMTTAEQDAFRAHLAAKVKDNLCPSCKANQWSIEGPFTMLSQDTGGSVVIGGKAMPLVALVCMNCFQTRTFAWLPIAQGGRRG
jgi:hypothetical protein